MTWDRRNVLFLANKKLPIAFFDDDDTQKYFAELNENIKMPRRKAMKSILLKEFTIMRENVKSILQNNDSKFSFNIDGWSAPNLKSYYGISVHFITKRWMFPSIALELVPSEGKHAGKDIANYFLNCLKSYGIQHKIQGITLDNVSSNTTFIKELKILLEAENIPFDVEDQHFRCFLHIFNLSVRDILNLVNKNSEITTDNENECVDEEGNDEEENESDTQEENDGINGENVFYNIILKIRTIVKKLRRRENLLNRLKSFCDASNVKFVKPILDVETRWNSTYDMLRIFFKLLPALKLMWNTCPELSDFRISDSQLSSLKVVCDLLIYFKHSTNVLSVEDDATLPTSVVAMNTLLDTLEQKMFELDEKPHRSSEDEILIVAIRNGRDKLLKHYHKCNWRYCVALILDPRFKIEGFDSSEWGKEMKETAFTKFKDIYLNEYYSRFHEIVSEEDSADEEEEELLNSRTFIPP